MKYFLVKCRSCIYLCFMKQNAQKMVFNTGFTSPVNPEMIVLARDSRGINQGMLAEAIRMSAPNLSKIERGEVSIDMPHLQAIAEATGYPLQFFYQAGSILPENLHYRKKQNLPQKMLTPIHAQANIIRQHVQRITRSLNIKAPELPFWPVSATQTPQRIAHKVRQKWQWDQPVINNLTRLLEKQGIIVYSFPFGTERADSKTIWTEDLLPVICVNSLLKGDRQRFSLAFELGQLIMHRAARTTAETDVVHEANLFAAELLMPEKDIRPDYEPGITVSLLGELKKKWKVSMIALLYRADDLGFTTDNQKRYILQQFNMLRIRRREPVELDIPFEEPRLLKQYLSQFKTKTRLSTAELAAVLCLHVSEFLDLYG